MIIVLVGPFCSGKDILGKILADRGFELISSSDFLRQEMRKEGIEITRENMQEYARNIRRKEISYPANRIAKTLKPEKNYVVMSLRNPHEVNEIKALGAHLVAVDAPESVRFERMKLRNREKDPMTFEGFKAIEEMELHGKGEKGFGFNIKGCMDMADHVIVNEGSFHELETQAEQLLGKLRK